MDKFSVSVNGSSRYVVSAKNPLGAIKSALPVIQRTESEAVESDVLEIRVSRAFATSKG